MKKILIAALIATAAVAQEKVDLTVVNKIKAEAFNNSQVMDHLFYLTDVYGPRMTGTPANKAAAEWTMNRLKSYGLQNVHLEKWGPFGQSWRMTHFAAHMIEPQYQPLIGVPLAWTSGTNGVVSGEPVLAVLKTDADLAANKGKLRGKVVLLMDLKSVEAVFTPLAHRLTDEELMARATTNDPSRMGGRGGATPSGQQAFRNRMYQFLKDEGVLVALQYGNPGDGGTIFATGGGSRNVNDPVPPPLVNLTPEHYNRIARLVAAKIPVKLEFDIRTEFLTADQDSFNIIGEIPGTTKRDETVMLGGHFDSWHGGTGATDNATGSSVAIEAVRILKALNLPMARTVRIALWNGEEQGLLGSKAYVQEHFANRETMRTTSEYARLSAYYNDDSGTGRFRGIGIGGNDMAKPIFEAWIAPFHDLGLTTVTGITAPPTVQPGGTDHTSFTWIGLPGFGFTQDPVEYGTRTHHSNMDVYDRVQKGDVMQASAIMASFVYNTATRAEMMPRMAMPKPLKPASTDKQ
jgi:hypothetical protein